MESCPFRLTLFITPGRIFNSLKQMLPFVTAPDLTSVTILLCFCFVLLIKFFLFYFQAVCRNNMNTVKFLLDCGVDLNVRDLYGFTPLKNAEAFENKEMIEKLRSAMETKSDTANS